MLTADLRPVSFTASSSFYGNIKLVSAVELNQSSSRRCLSPSVVLQLQYLQSRWLSELFLLVFKLVCKKKNPSFIFTAGGTGSESLKCEVMWETEE